MNALVGVVVGRDFFSEELLAHCPGDSKEHMGNALVILPVDIRPLPAYSAPVGCHEGARLLQVNPPSILGWNPSTSGPVTIPGCIVATLRASVARYAFQAQRSNRL